MWMDATFIGHISVDMVTRGGEMRKAMGGTVVYGSVAATKHGYRSSIISKVGRDFPDEYLIYLSRLGIDISGIKVSNKPTTKFKLVYENSERKLYLLSKCEDISSFDLTSRFIEGHVVLIGPLIGEISLDAIKYISTKAELAALDIQGFVRKVNPDKSITLQPMENALTAIGLVDIVHAELSEAETLVGTNNPEKAGKNLVEAGTKIALVTMGENGAYIVTREESFYVPAAKPSRVVDLTGSGDVFTTVFTLEYHKTRNLKRAAAMAAAAVSFLIEKEGISGLRPRWQIRRRAEYILRELQQTKETSEDQEKTN
ncbi:MAG TPA: hypothetical protein ENJ59_00770 [Thermofilum sp.]|nr:hypothetical protein [Thermofilum sp.]